MPTTSGIETCRPSWSLSNNRNAPAANSTTPTAPSRPWPTCTSASIRPAPTSSNSRPVQVNGTTEMPNSASTSIVAAGEAREDHPRVGDLERDQDQAAEEQQRDQVRVDQDVEDLQVQRQRVRLDLRVGDVDLDALGDRRAPVRLPQEVLACRSRRSRPRRSWRASAAVAFAASRTAFSAQSAFRSCVVASARMRAAASLTILFLRSPAGRSCPSPTGVDEPMLVCGAMPARSEAWTTNTPAEAARAPSGAT